MEPAPWADRVVPAESPPFPQRPAPGGPRFAPCSAAGVTSFPARFQHLRIYTSFLVKTTEEVFRCLMFPGLLEKAAHSAPSLSNPLLWSTGLF